MYQLSKKLVSSRKATAALEMSYDRFNFNPFRLDKFDDFPGRRLYMCGSIWPSSHNHIIRIKVQCVHAPASCTIVSSEAKPCKASSSLQAICECQSRSRKAAKRVLLLNRRPLVLSTQMSVVRDTLTTKKVDESLRQRSPPFLDCESRSPLSKLQPSLS